MFYIVYQTTNLLNGKIYIGQHKTKNPLIFDGYFGSSKYLLEDIQILGSELFERVTLHIYRTREKALEKEAQLINKDFVLRSDTYNRSLGGLNCDLGGTIGGTTSGKLAGLRNRLQNDYEYAVGFSKKVSEGLKQLYSVNPHHWVDRKHSDITKHRMQEAHQRNKHQQGSKNSNYGKCWIYNDNIAKNKLIKKDDLQEWLDQGWQRGCKRKYGGSMR